MNPEPPILAPARLLKQLGPRHWQAELPNGAPLIAHLEHRSVASLKSQLQVKSLVRLELTPFDFSKGRIVAIESK